MSDCVVRGIGWEHFILDRGISLAERAFRWTDGPVPRGDGDCSCSNVLSGDDALEHLQSS